MIKISNIKELQKIFGDRIVAQSGIMKNHVLNGQSLYGATLQKNVTESVVESFKEEDSYAVFNINNDISNDDIVEEVDDSLTTYASFQATVMFYGKNCAYNAIQVKSRFLTEELISDFHANGVHIQEIESQKQVTDFINGKLIIRQDIIIHFSCEILTTMIDRFFEYEDSEITNVYDVDGQ